jgi:hypothetical protein
MAFTIADAHTGLHRDRQAGGYQVYVDTKGKVPTPSDALY